MDSTACPRCACRMSKVIETRNVNFQGQYLRVRIRLCRNCKISFRTKETVILEAEDIPLRKSRVRSLDVGTKFDPEKDGIW